MLRLIGLVFVLFHARSISHGTVILGTGNLTSIECAAEAELTFKVIRNKSNKSLTVGECDLIIKSCRIFETPLTNKISLSFTGRGGILRINSLDEETVGTYICCETFNPDKFVSTHIVWPYEVIVNNSEYRPMTPIYSSANHSGETSATTETDTAKCIGISIGAVICVALCLGICHRKRLRVCVWECVLEKLCPIPQVRSLDTVTATSPLVMPQSPILLLKSETTHADHDVLFDMPDTSPSQLSFHSPGLSVDEVTMETDLMTSDQLQKHQQERKLQEHEHFVEQQKKKHEQEQISVPLRHPEAIENLLVNLLVNSGNGAIADLMLQELKTLMQLHQQNQMGRQK